MRRAAFKLFGGDIRPRHCFYPSFSTTPLHQFHLENQSAVKDSISSRSTETYASAAWFVSDLSTISTLVHSSIRLLSQQLANQLCEIGDHRAISLTHPPAAAVGDDS